MKKSPSTEKILLEEVSQTAQALQQATRGLPMGEFIKRIRYQLKMSQSALAKRVGIPQATISRIEHNQQNPTLLILSKILKALSCELVAAPMLKEPIDVIRHQQASRVAARHLRYLRGTMKLEKQEPDNRLFEELSKKEVEELLRGSGKRLWEE
jgi:transcriptional regulator with XRE-family HTH domain